MSLSSPFIHRPIATTLLAMGLAIAGIVAFYLLPVSSLPEIDFPTITVTGLLPGGSPETMATSVATPLERQLSRIAGITQMTSTSTLGVTGITIQFDLTRDIDGAASDVQAAINAARGQLPANLPSNPTYRKVNPADAPILILAMTSPIHSTGQLYDYASTILAQALSQINGVGQVLVGGSSLPGVRVELNPVALNSYGISLNSVQEALQNANSNRPKGQLIDNGTTSEISTNDQLLTAKEYRPLIIRYQNNNPVRIADVAEVTDSVENVRNAGLANGKPAVMLVLFKQPGANVVSTVDRVYASLPFLKATIPSAIDITIAMDRTTTIRASLHDVEFTLVIAIILVIFVVYLFLGNLRSMLIPSVAVPLSLLGTFGVMKLMGYTLDNLSLMALTISTGFVVDDAVVVLENITRHIEEGVKPFDAALQGAKEVGFTVISMSLSLIAVFIPILLMGGIVGRLFREFAITLSTAILVSLLISLTVTPMMCAYLLKKEAKTKHHIFVTGFNKLHAYYEKTLQIALRHPKLMLFITLFAIVLNGFLFVIVPKGFFPQQDTGRIIAQIQADQDISFQAMVVKLKNFVNIVTNDPAVSHVVGFIGGAGGSTTNSGSVFISLKSLGERNLSVNKIIDRLRKELSGVTGATLYMQAAQDLLVGGRVGNAQYQYTLTTDSLEELNTWAPRVLASVKTLPGIVDVNSDQLSHGLQSFVRVDRDSAARLGITMQDIDSTLYNAFGQAQVSIMYRALNQYHVVMEVAPQYWQTPETLKVMYVPAANGTLVPLSTFADFSASNTLLSVNHQGQSPAATISFNLAPGVALGDAVKAITAHMKKMHLPETVLSSFQGTAQAFQDSLANEGFLILAALVAVYIVLGMLYESTIHPLTILSTLPTAGVGALLALLITRIEFSIIALIGLILLIGIVKKNAIMMIDFALEAKRSENKSSFDAIYQAAVLRFRPIMMTTLAAMFGAFPLAFGTGIGSELRRPLGVAIIGGLVLSQLLTLYTTPVIYLMLERVSEWRWSFRKRGVV
jgi:multidrug efflux pump